MAILANSEMSMNQLGLPKWACAYKNKDFICVHTQSGNRALVFDPNGIESFLDPSAEDGVLGLAILKSLEKSYFVPDEEAREFLDFRLAAQRYGEWTSALRRKASMWPAR